VRALAYFGGVPEIAVPDNLKSGVSGVHRYEPEVNLPGSVASKTGSLSSESHASRLHEGERVGRPLGCVNL
jgi:hypothetical protein